MNLFFRREPRVDSAPAKTAPGFAGGGLVTANGLFGDKVVTPRNETLGTVTELLLDAPRGCIAYAVIAHGGFMGVDQQFYAVPWTALAWDAENRRLVLDADRATLAGAPRFDRERWAQEAGADWHEAVHRHYRTRPYWE